MTPQTRGSVDYPSTRGNTRECRVTRHFSQKSGRVSFVRGALPKYKTCIYLSQTVQYNHNDTNMDKNGLLNSYYNIHKNIPTLSNSSKSTNVLLLYNIYFENTVSGIVKPSITILKKSQINGSLSEPAIHGHSWPNPYQANI